MSPRDEVKSFVLKNGDKYIIYRGSNIRTYDHLPLGVYRTGTDMFGNIFLTVADEFLLPNKIYGSTKVRAKRILDTFKRREQSTGVLLSGEKGAGKTMLAKYLCMEAMDEGFTTIIADGNAVSSPAFVSFMESLVEPTVVLMDEFEKMFENNNEQNHLLSLFDGVSQSKKLYILTANDPIKINDYFKARPGRLFYNFAYAGLETEVVREVAADHNIPEEFLTKLIDHVEACERFNFDSLIAIIEEWERYGLSFEETVEGLNIVQKPVYHWDDSYEVALQNDSFSKPVVLFEEKRMNLRSGAHIHLNTKELEAAKKNPENNPQDVDKLVEILTEGQALTTDAYKTWLEDESTPYVYASDKGRVARRGNREILRDLANPEHGLRIVLERKDVLPIDYYAAL